MDRSLIRTASGSERVAEVSRSVRRALLSMVSFLVFFNFACSEGTHRYGIPAGAQAVLDTSIEDIDAGRYEKLYLEAADEWRKAATLEESKATFNTLREKLGKVRTRDLQTAREEQTSTGPIPGHSLIIVYQVSFDQTRGNPPQPVKGMETFTLLEHGGRWYLARYLVTSNELR